MFKTVQTILARYGGDNTLPPVLTNIRVNGLEETPLIVFCILNSARQIDRCVFASKRKHAIIGTSPIDPRLGPDGVEGWNYSSSAFRALDNVWLRFADNRTPEEFMETAAMYTNYLVTTGCQTIGVLAQLFLPQLADTASLASFCGMPEEELIKTAEAMRDDILTNLKVNLELPSPNGIERIRFDVPEEERTGSRIDRELLKKMGFTPLDEKKETVKDTAAGTVKEKPAERQEQEKKTQPVPERKQKMEEETRKQWQIPAGLPDVSDLPDVKAYIMAVRKYGTTAVCRFVRFIHTDFAKDCASSLAYIIEHNAASKVFIRDRRTDTTDDGVSIYIVNDYVPYATQDFDASTLKRVLKYPEHYKALMLKSAPEEFDSMIRKCGIDIANIPPQYFAQRTLVKHCQNSGDNDDGQLHYEDLMWLSANRQNPLQRNPVPKKQPEPAPRQEPRPVPKPEPKREVKQEQKPAFNKPEAKPQKPAEPAKPPVQEAPKAPEKEPEKTPEPVAEPEAKHTEPEHSEFYYKNLDVIKANSELAEPVIEGLEETIKLLEESDNQQVAPLIDKYKGYVKERVISRTYVNDYLSVTANHRSKPYAATYATAQRAIKFEEEHRKLEYGITCIECGKSYKTDVSAISVKDPVVRCTCPHCGKKEEFSI